MNVWPPLVAALAAALGATQETATQGSAAHDADRWLAALDGRDPIAREEARRRLFFARAVEPLAATAASLPATAWMVRVELLRALDGPRAATVALARWRDRDPAVRTVAAGALALASEPWPEEAVATLLVDEDTHVAQALLDGLDRASLPARRRFARRFRAPLLAQLDRGDPEARGDALALLAADDDPAAGRALLSSFAALAPFEQVALLERIADLAPRWEPETLLAFARDADRDGSRALGWRLAARFDPAWRATLSDATLGEIVAAAGAVPSAAQQHAAAALAALLPDVAARLPSLLPALELDGGFEGALDVALRCCGTAALDQIVAQLTAPRADARTAVPLFAPLVRLPSRALARRLDEEVAPRLDPRLRGELCELALRMPACEARDRLLLEALHYLTGDARVRPFEAIARGGDAALLPALLAALDGERDARHRGRMIEQIAVSFGLGEADDVLKLIEAQWRSPRPADRVAALRGLPFVALGEREDAVAKEAIERFEESEPETLLRVLGQVGGPVAEGWLEALAGRLQHDAARVDLYRLLLSRAGRLGSAATRPILTRALDDARPAVREAALRALVEAGEPVALEAVPAIVRGLDPAARAAILSDLGDLRLLPGYPALIATLLAQSEDEEDRAALLELAEPSLREVLLPVVMGRLDASKESDERHVLLAALGQIGGTLATARLDTTVATALALPDDGLREEEPAVSEGRTALLALAGSDPAAATARIAEFLLRSALAGAATHVEQRALGLPSDTAPADPALVAALAQRPAAESVAALDAAWARLGEAMALNDERFFADAAQIAADAGAPDALADWFDDRVLELWPAGSVSDFLALLPEGGRREALQRGELSTVDASLLRDLPALRTALASGGVAGRELQSALGRVDLLQGATPARTLAALAGLAEVEAAGNDRARAEAAFAAAAREASECATLLAELARCGERRGFALPADLAAKAQAPRPDGADGAGLRRMLEADRRP